jgi:hypothetical protein
VVPHIICTVFIIARVCSRLFLLRKWFLDDALIIVAWLFSTAVCIVYSIAVQTPGIQDAVALNNNSDTGKDVSISTYTLNTYLGLIFYQLCLLLTKLSVLSFYLRMFSSRPTERRLAIITIVIVILYGIPLFFISILQCQPSSATTFFSHQSGIPKCFSFNPLLITSASLHTATDAWLIILVIPCIAALALPRGQKVALATVLSLGVFVIAASMTRLQLSLQAGYSPTGNGVRVANTLAFFVMTVLECDVALMCACAPTLKPLLARLWPVFAVDGVETRRRRARRIFRRRWAEEGDGEGESGEDEDSGNLTAVSYHGYPWAQNNITAISRNKTPSAANVDAEMVMPSLPVPAIFRTQTTLSLRSFMSNMAPRSRGQTEDRENLLVDGVGRERKSSVRFEGYYEQYLGNGDEKERRRSRGPVRDSLGIWGGSQESFVLGMNDQASPSRLSPVSASSGTTSAVLGDGGG